MCFGETIFGIYVRGLNLILLQTIILSRERCKNFVVFSESNLEFILPRYDPTYRHRFAQTDDWTVLPPTQELTLLRLKQSGRDRLRTLPAPKSVSAPGSTCASSAKASIRELQSLGSSCVSHCAYVCCSTPPEVLDGSTTHTEMESHFG